MRRILKISELACQAVCDRYISFKLSFELLFLLITDTALGGQEERVPWRPRRSHRADFSRSVPPQNDSKGAQSSARQAGKAPALKWKDSQTVLDRCSASSDLPARIGTHVRHCCRIARFCRTEGRHPSAPSQMHHTFDSFLVEDYFSWAARPSATRGAQEAPSPSIQVPHAFFPSKLAICNHVHCVVIRLLQASLKSTDLQNEDGSAG